MMAARSALLVLACSAMAQTPEPKLDRVIGEVTAINAGANQISVKSDGGAVVTAAVNDKTLYLSVPPGEKDLKKAARIALTNVAVGDRAFVRGHFSEDQKSIQAVAVIIMTKAQLAQKQEHDREEWKQRSLAGPVTAINPDAKEVTITTRSREGSKPVVVEVGDHTDFRQYAPESVRFSDAKPSSFAELKTGDQLRVLGEKNDDGTRIKAEAIVFGSFRNVAGVIKSVNAESNEITLTDLVAHSPVTVRISSDTVMRRLPPQLAMMLARRVQGTAAAAAAAAGQGAGARPANVAQGVPGPGGPNGAKPGAGGPPSDQGQGGMHSRAMDFQDMLERLPQMKVDDLKAGDAIMLSGSGGADPGHVTAINLLAGVEPLLTAAPKGGQQIFGSWNFDIGPQE